LWTRGGSCESSSRRLLKRRCDHAAVER
jgi:hypothetical protein